MEGKRRSRMIIIDNQLISAIGLAELEFFRTKADLAFLNSRIQTWALEEARRRLEAEGILEDPNPGGPKVGWDESWARPGGSGKKP